MAQPSAITDAGPADPEVVLSPPTGTTIGGLAGADQKCQMLADAMGTDTAPMQREWVALMSAGNLQPDPSGGVTEVHAKDRVAWNNRPVYNMAGQQLQHRCSGQSARLICESKLGGLEFQHG